MQPTKQTGHQVITLGHQQLSADYNTKHDFVQFYAVFII